MDFIDTAMASAGSGDVIIVIIPEQHRSFAGRAGCQRVDIRRLPNAVGQDTVQRGGAAAHRRNAITPHQSSHAEKIQHRLVDSIGRQRAIPVEIGFAFKLKSPGQHREQVHVLAICKLEQTLHRRRCITGIQRPVAISIGRVETRGAGRTTLRIRFTQDDGEALELRELAHNGKAIRSIVQFVVEAHLHVTVDHIRASFYVEGDKVERDSDRLSPRFVYWRSGQERLADTQRHCPASGPGRWSQVHQRAHWESPGVRPRLP